jgi:hypothetical protein
MLRLIIALVLAAIPLTFAAGERFQGVVSEPSGYVIVPGDNGLDFDDAGATGAITFTLPGWRPGLRFCFTEAARQTMTVKTTLGASVVTGGASTIAVLTSTVNSRLCVKATEPAIWEVDGQSGSWTFE